jgi:catechol 2,3-dioxygenase-like lactoylglutathione lyase family enzyme
MTDQPILAGATVVAFAATTDAARARAFYVGTLGLALRSEDDFAISLDAGGTELRLQKVERLTPQPFTALGWQVSDVEAVVRRLAARGVSMERYPFLSQDAQGVWSAPSGTRVAWFKDPDANLLSVAEYPRG